MGRLSPRRTKQPRHDTTGQKRSTTVWDRRHPHTSSAPHLRLSLSPSLSLPLSLTPTPTTIRRPRFHYSPPCSRANHCRPAQASRWLRTYIQFAGLGGALLEGKATSCELRAQSYVSRPSDQGGQLQLRTYPQAAHLFIPSIIGIYINSTNANTITTDKTTIDI